MVTTLVLFPNQLIQTIPKSVDQVILIEHPFYYRRDNVHMNQLRCVYTRATVDLWVQHMEGRHTIHWHRLSKPDGFKPILSKWIRDSKQIQIMDPVDDALLQEVTHAIKKTAPKASVDILDSPLFLFTRDQLQEFVDSKQNEMKRVLHHSSFYSWSRKQLDVLMTKNNKVEGGKLSFDTSNRQPLSSKEEAEVPHSHYFLHAKSTRRAAVIKEACAWVSKHFYAHPGGSVKDWKETAERLRWFAITHTQAMTLMDSFIQHKLPRFGTFQDAVGSESNTNSLFLYHSNVSHCLNNGLLDITKLVKRVEDWFYTSKHDDRTQALAQAEGFLRQVIGWREFNRLAAWKYRSELWKSNGLRARKKLTKDWYEGTTGNAPVDATIQKAFDTGYLHHIERLMIMGNYMTLSEIQPKEMYRWFMEFAMDSYDWVMILNVFAMASYADKGIAFTKPYISSSNYIRKLTHYTPEPEWTEDWDAKYYRFLAKHKKLFESNPRMNFMMRGLKKHLASSKE